MRLIYTLILAACSLSAAYTPVYPAPPGETDLAVIVSDLCPSCVRIDDDFDRIFPVPGFGPLYLIAFEDLPIAYSDNDYNDWIGWYDPLANLLTFAAGFSGDSHVVTSEYGVVSLDSAGNCCGTADFTSLSLPDRMVSYGTPAAPNTVPEPASVVLVGAGLLALAWRRRR